MPNIDNQLITFSKGLGWASSGTTATTLALFILTLSQDSTDRSHYIAGGFFIFALPFLVLSAVEYRFNGDEPKSPKGTFLVLASLQTIGYISFLIGFLLLCYGYGGYFYVLILVLGHGIALLVSIAISRAYKTSPTSSVSVTQREP